MKAQPAKGPSETLAAEPKGSLSMFPDLWMKPEQMKMWDSMSAKETIKAERVDGFNEEERLAYRLGVDEGLWFVAMPMLEANAKPDASLKAAVEKLPTMFKWGDKRPRPQYVDRFEVLKLIAEATKQEEPKGMRA